MPTLLLNKAPKPPARKPSRNIQKPRPGIMTPPRRKSPPNVSLTPRMSLFKRGTPMTDKAAIPDAWRPFGKPRGTRDPELNLDARAQAFLDRIAPLSADLAAHGRTRALALKKLRRICQAELRRLKVRTDVAREDDLVALIEKTVGTFGGLHIAFNNAGAEGQFGLLTTEQTVEHYHQVCDINIRGVLHEA